MGNRDRFEEWLRQGVPDRSKYAFREWPYRKRPLRLLRYLPRSPIRRRRQLLDALWAQWQLDEIMSDADALREFLQQYLHARSHANYQFGEFDLGVLQFFANRLANQGMHGSWSIPPAFSTPGPEFFWMKMMQTCGDDWVDQIREYLDSYHTHFQITREEYMRLRDLEAEIRHLEIRRRATHHDVGDGVSTGADVGLQYDFLKDFTEWRHRRGANPPG